MCETGMKGGRKRKQWLRYGGKLKKVVLPKIGILYNQNRKNKQKLCFDECLCVTVFQY